MAQLLVCDNEGLLTADIEANGPVLGAALENEYAETVVRCAVLLAMSALAQGGSWPTAALEYMSEFMAAMKQSVCASQLM